jgi:hypothetical protein
VFGPLAFATAPALRSAFLACQRLPSVPARPHRLPCQTTREHPWEPCARPTAPQCPSHPCTQSSRSRRRPKRAPQPRPPPTHQPVLPSAPTTPVWSLPRRTRGTMAPGVRPMTHLIAVRQPVTHVWQSSPLPRPLRQSHLPQWLHPARSATQGPSGQSLSLRCPHCPVSSPAEQGPPGRHLSTETCAHSV